MAASIILLDLDKFKYYKPYQKHVMKAIMGGKRDITWKRQETLHEIHVYCIIYYYIDIYVKFGHSMCLIYVLNDILKYI